MANAQGVNTDLFARRMYEILGPVIKAAAKKSDDSNTDGQKNPPDESRTKAADTAALERYTGTYESGFAGEYAIVIWENGLAALRLPTLDPVKALTKLKRTGELTFRRTREDDETLGAAIASAIAIAAGYGVSRNLVRSGWRV